MVTTQYPYRSNYSFEMNKQEKWMYSHWNELNIRCHVDTIGAVFDFFVWRRYIIGNNSSGIW